VFTRTVSHEGLKPDIEAPCAVPSAASITFEVSHLPGRSEIRRKLYEKAFTAAGDRAKSKPAPGTPEWVQWKALCDEAIAANAEYMKELERAYSPRP